MYSLDNDLTPHMKKHYENERETLRVLLELEKRFREYYDQFLCEVDIQKELLDRLWLLSQRYIILCSTGPCCKFPEVYTLSAEETIINEYEEKLELVRSSNNRLKHSVLDLNDLCKEFHDKYYKLDMAMETPFILGDKYHRPIKHFKEMVTDIIKYFFASVLEMKVRQHQCEPMNCCSIEDYRPLIAHCEEFEEYLLVGFTYCNCLGPKPVCPIPKRQCPKLNL